MRVPSSARLDVPAPQALRREAQAVTAESPSALHRLLTADPGEQDVELARPSIEGEIPAELLGGFYALNGPGRVRLGGRTAHPFDGHGLIRAFWLRGAHAARFQSRYVRTDAFLAESAAERLLYSGVGSSVAPRSLWPHHVLRNVLSRRVKNVANTTIFKWAGRLFAGWEGGLPHALDAKKLTTLGLETFGGALSGSRCLAHAKVDHGAGRLVTVSITMGPRTTLVFREIDAAGKVVSTREHRVSGSLLLHDFAITQSYYVFVDAPMRINYWKLAAAALGLGDLISVLSPRLDLPAHVVLVPRDGARGEARRIRLAEPFFVVHYANAFERGDGSVVLDAAASTNMVIDREFGFRSSDLPLDPFHHGSDASPDLDACLVRVELDLASGRSRLQRAASFGLDFPRVHPDREGLETAHIYAAGGRSMPASPLFDSVVHCDHSSGEPRESRWTPGNGCFVGEPVYAPRPGSTAECDGFVLVVAYDVDGARSELCILRAEAVERGPVARIRLPFLLPYGFHGSWIAKG
jgi:carotenoid cleavage dioxygenase-like enzyme